MKIYCDAERQRLHSPRQFLVAGAFKPSPEVPARVDALLEAASGHGHQRADPSPLVKDADDVLGCMAMVHTPRYLRFLATIHERWSAIDGAGEDVLANVHPDRRWAGYPDAPVGQAGFHMADTACPIGAESWDSIRSSAACSVAAAREVTTGASSAYALCRPPGHHAFAEMAGGFCYVNNAAIAAGVLRESHARVAIVDVDLHHGNGTQSIFYSRPDVLTVSVHADPAGFYPYFWGYANERGEDAGLGYNLNYPLPRGSGDDVFLAGLDEALIQVRAFAPGALVVALGLDAFEGDPFGGLRVSTNGFARVGERLARLGLPTVLVQEGGYPCDELGTNLVSALAGFESAHKAGANG